MVSVPSYNSWRKITKNQAQKQLLAVEGHLGKTESLTNMNQCNISAVNIIHMSQEYLFCTCKEVTEMWQEINTHQLNYRSCSGISSFLLLSIHVDNVRFILIKIYFVLKHPHTTTIVDLLAYRFNMSTSIENRIQMQCLLPLKCI